MEDGRKMVISIQNKLDVVKGFYPIGAKSFKFDMFMSGTSFICIEDTMLFVWVLKTDKRPRKKAKMNNGI